MHEKWMESPDYRKAYEANADEFDRLERQIRKRNPAPPLVASHVRSDIGYPCTIRWEEDIYIACFPDFPESAGYGDTIEEALLSAAESLDACIWFRERDGQQRPKPSDVFFVVPVAEPEELVKLAEAERARELQCDDADVRIGSSLNDFLAEEGILEGAQAKALKEARLWAARSKAGHARAAALSPERRREIAAMGARARMENIARRKF